MKTIKILSLIISLSAVLFSCNNAGKKTKTIGVFETPVSTKVSLYKLTQDKAVLVDSTTLTNEKEFEFAFDVVYPTFYMLKYFNNEKIYLICKPGENLEVKIENVNNSLQYYVDGSYDSKLLRNLVFEQEKTKSYISNLSNQYEKAFSNGFSEHPSVYYDSIYNTLLEKHKNYSTNFIHDNIQSLASIFALYQDFGIQKPMMLFDKQDDFELFSKVDSVLTPLYPNTDAVISLNKDVVQAKERYNFNLGSGTQLRRGVELPDFNMKSIDGSEISTDVLNNKIVLYYVFASWDNLHDHLIEQVAALGKKYKSKDFMIVGISLDKSINELRKFLNANKVKFPVICDQLYWDSPLVKKLQIQNLPYFILTDKNGLLISNQLKMNEIESTIDAHIN